jgi:hypothetical protein
MLVLLTALLAAGPAAPTLRTFDSPAEALRAALAGGARVIAFGEYHEIEGAAPGIHSAIARFAEELLEVVQDDASDLVVETWVTEGNCGKQEKQVVREVEETTKRPEATESEIVKLIKRAKANGVQPHILQLSCKDYQALLDDKNEIDYVRLLATVTDLLRKKIIERLKAGDKNKTILVYGGALHNDVYPRAELKAFTFAPQIAKATKGRYREIDLYVPEYIEHDKNITAEAWYPSLLKADADKTALVRRGASSYIIVFPRSH